jgi:hypothetical protein
MPAATPILILRPESSQAHDLRTIPADQAEGTCESCSLPLRNFGAYELPPLRGRFCSLLCIETELFGRGRCNWCGSSMDNSRSRAFCREYCQQECGKAEAQGARFGDGARLRRWVGEKKARHCLQCGGSLEGRRANAEFCSDDCKKRYTRRENAEKPI